MKTDRVPSLDDLAFANRNKAYGGYLYRKKYPSTMLISMVAGIVILLLMVMAPWLIYQLEPIPLIEGDLMYEVNYLPMDPPADDLPDRLAGMLNPPATIEEKAPVVTDSVVVEEEKKITEEKPLQDPEAKTDTAPKEGPEGFGEGSGIDQGVVVTADVHPKFPGGDEYRLYYLRQNIRYPDAAIKGNIQGTVVVVFVVETDGLLTNIEVTRKLGGGCDEEAIRVIRAMPRWEPGKRNGRPVRVLIKMPIVFRIPGR
jgi:protein TonB